jgi:import inner membrane translocase subunit TIM50
VNKNFLKN